MASQEVVVKTKVGERKANSRLMIWIVAVIIALLMFYGLDQFVMSIQGLPLNWDLTPAQ